VDVPIREEGDFLAIGCCFTAMHSCANLFCPFLSRPFLNITAIIACDICHYAKSKLGYKYRSPLFISLFYVRNLLTESNAAVSAPLDTVSGIGELRAKDAVCSGMI
jgi:hypothetical protein